MNARNEVVHLRQLLFAACTCIEEYYPEIMPQGCRRWYETQKLITKTRRNARLRGELPEWHKRRVAEMMENLDV